jgi:PAS domain S-box-containing protein
MSHYEPKNLLHAIGGLTENPALFELIANAVPVLIYLHDLADGRDIFVNDQRQAVFGHSSRKTPREFLELVHPDDLPRLLNARERLAAAADGTIVETEFRARHESGEFRWYEDRVVALTRLPDRNPLQVLGTVHDVTARKRNEASLARFALAIEGTSDAVGIADDTGRTEYMNPAAQALYGYTVEELNAVGSSALYACEETRRAVAVSLRARRLFAGDVDVRTRDGRIVPMLWRVTPLVDADGRSTGSLGVGTDMTEHRRAEAEARLHQAELANALRLASLGEMAADIAHELNQPLAAIASFASGCARRIRAGSADLGELLMAVEQISHEAIRGGQVVRRVKHLVEKRDPRREPIDVGTLVREVTRMVDRELRQAAVELHVELPEKVPVLSGDRIQLEQVLLNLVRNAIDAMQGTPAPTRKIGVSIATSGAEVVIEVRDHGPGLQGNASQVFAPFFTTKRGHLGLGLSVSRSMVESHGGRLSAADNNPTGATFRVALPCPLP